MVTEYVVRRKSASRENCCELGISPPLMERRELYGLSDFAGLDYTLMARDSH